MQKPAPGLRKTRLYTPTYSQSHRYRVPGVFLIPSPGVSIQSFTPSSVNAGQELYRAVRGWGGIVAVARRDRVFNWVLVREVA